MSDRNPFSSASLEGTLRHATSPDSYLDEIEPEPEKPRDLLAESISAILEECMNRKGFSDSGNQALTPHLESSFRKFIALVLIVRPDLLPGNLPNWRIAEGLGCTRQCLSIHCVNWSDFLGGMKAPGMKSQEARETYRQNKSTGSKRPKRKADRIGGRVDTAMRVHNETTIILAFERFLNGSDFDTRQRTALQEAGLIDSESMFTEAGRERLQVAQQEREEG